MNSAPPAPSAAAAVISTAKPAIGPAVTELHRTHYRSLVRLAALLIGDVRAAEEVVQDTFADVCARWLRLRGKDGALPYLRRSVVNRSYSVLRHRTVADRDAPRPTPDMPGAERGALARLELSGVVSALGTLPVRQRQAIVLRYYAGLSEAQTAAAMRTSQSAVKTHTAGAMDALREVLEREP